MHLEYIEYIKSYVVPYVTGILDTNVMTVYWHIIIFLAQFYVLALYLETI